MIYRPIQIGAFEFAVVAALRAEQLRRGCVPRVEGDHKFVVTAQLEVVAGKVVRAVEGAVEELLDAVASAPPPAVLGHGASPDSDVAPTAALTSVGSGDVIGREEVS